MRVVADLIRADDIIDCKEISYLEKMRARYHIAPDDECMAEKLTFCRCVAHIVAVRCGIAPTTYNGLY